MLNREPELLKHSGKTGQQQPANSALGNDSTLWLSQLSEFPNSCDSAMSRLLSALIT